MNLMHFVQQGGVFMVPLLALSVLAMAVALERALYFANLDWGGEAFRQRLLSLLGEGKQEEAGNWLRGKRGAVASTALAGAWVAPTAGVTTCTCAWTALVTGTDRAAGRPASVRCSAAPQPRVRAVRT